MKSDIHPKYQDTTFICACGARYIAGSTIGEEFHTEICSACHPFYTGKQKLIDTSGRVDKFMAKMKKAQDIASKKKSKKAKETAETEEASEEKEETKKSEE